MKAGYTEVKNSCQHFQKAQNHRGRIAQSIRRISTISKKKNVKNEINNNQVATQLMVEESFDATFKKLNSARTVRWPANS